MWEVLLLGCSLGAMALWGITETLRGQRKRGEANQKRDRKRDQCARSIDDLRKHLDANPMSLEEINRITGLRLVDLIKHLKDGSITPLQALKAYQTKALEVHGRTNCLIEPIKEAEKWAEELANGPREGLLYGVPISLKEDIVLKGYDNTLGCVEFIDKPKEDDSPIVKVLKRHGAVPFVRTNIPQLTFSFEPGNPIFGTVLNPHNLAHGPGGSSSGEAALACSGASPLGIGSDLAGSIRLPSHFCGICGFKPTAQRMSNVRYIPGYSCYGANEIGSVYGPIAPEVDNIVLALKALWDAASPSLSDLDPMAVPQIFNEQVYASDRKLRIGFFAEDDVCPVFPGCARAVWEVKAMLEEAGHELVPWKLPDMAQLQDMHLAVIQPNGASIEQELLKYDKVDPSIGYFIGEPSKFDMFWKLANKLLMSGLSSAGMVKQMDLKSFFLLVSKLRDFTTEVMTQWRAAGLDAMLCPPVATPALPLGNPQLLIFLGVYTMAYNCLNMPAGVVPVTKVTAQDIEDLKDYPDHNPLYAEAKRMMSKTLGMPMGVMVVSPRYKDETSLRLMKEIQEVAKKHKK